MKEENYNEEIFKWGYTNHRYCLCEERLYRFIHEYVIKPRLTSWEFVNQARLHPNWPKRSDAGNEEELLYLANLWKWVKEWLPKEEKSNYYNNPEPKSVEMDVYAEEFEAWMRRKRNDNLP